MQVATSILTLTRSFLNFHQNDQTYIKVLRTSCKGCFILRRLATEAVLARQDLIKTYKMSKSAYLRVDSFNLDDRKNASSTAPGSSHRPDLEERTPFQGMNLSSTLEAQEQDIKRRRRRKRLIGGLTLKTQMRKVVVTTARGSTHTYRVGHPSTVSSVNPVYSVLQLHTHMLHL